RVKTCLVFGFTGTRSVASIVDEQHVESSFAEPLAQPTHVRNVAAVAVKENDSRSAGLFRTFEIPAVQPVSISSRKPRIRCSRRWRRQMAQVHANRMKCRKPLHPPY